jgi:hypothetical protein
MLPPQISLLLFSPLTAILWILALLVLTYLIVAFRHGRKLRRHDEPRSCRMLRLEMWPQVLEELQRRQRDYERRVELQHRIEPSRNWYRENRVGADTLSSGDERGNLIKTPTRRPRGSRARSRTERPRSAWGSRRRSGGPR